MFQILPITLELLAELGDELGGCDFTDPNQINFLREDASCDVQAAPGNGKTTLIAAKIALLSRSWTSSKHGICIISHTNAARTEVEELIGGHPTAARLMSHPHFTGTVTAFINQYLALPYLRGLGWRIRQIDDDVFAAEALRRYPSFWALKRHAGRAAATVENWVTLLNLDPNFDDQKAQPDSLQVLRQKGQHGADTDCGKALAELKASMVKDGFYRYADMIALAWRALHETPTLVTRLRQRFPLVLLDEAQDTHGESLRLLEHVFKGGGTAFQRLGDSNQTLYEDNGADATYWTPGPACIPLDTSRRFGIEIAAFASRLTTRKAQTIIGVGAKPGSRVIFLFDENTIGDVLGAFAKEARALWRARIGTREVWAVSSRHNLVGKKKGSWQPKSLVDYHPAYRSVSGAREKSLLLCHQLQKAVLHHAAAGSPAQVSDMLAIGIATFAHIYGWKTANDRPITAHNVWPALAFRNVALPRAVRRLLRDHVLRGNAVWEQAAWLEFINKLRGIFGPPLPAADVEITHFCTFLAEQKVSLAELERRSTKQAHFGDFTLQLGSIHSVKGKSVDGILIMESEVWKGRGAKDKCIDLTAVLPRAFGISDTPFTDVELTAATNVFVGVTRARELLGLAFRKSEAATLIGPAREQGWKIVDLVGEQPLRDDRNT